MNTQDDLTKAVKETARFAQSAPQWFAVLAVVGMFLGFLWQHEKTLAKFAERAEIVAKQRIDQCHNVQSRSLDVMDAVTKVLAEQQLSMQSLAEAIRDLEARIEKLGD